MIGEPMLARDMLQDARLAAADVSFDTYLHKNNGRLGVLLRVRLASEWISDTGSHNAGFKMQNTHRCTVQNKCKQGDNVQRRD